MSRKQKNETDFRIKKKPMTWLQWFAIYGAMLLLVGIQVGIIVFPPFQDITPFLQVSVIMIYWGIVATAFVLVTNAQIKQSYDKPMGKLSTAAKQVAEGDFSVYIEPMHTADNYDYIDVMFLDFNTMVQELGSIETLTNDFVSNVSHEIKTPLAIIKNYTTILKSGALDEETSKEYMDTIIKATDNLTALVSNILKLNKLDNQEIETVPIPFDLCRQLSDCILSFETVWEKKNVNVIVDIEDKAMITVDENMLEIIWNNLISNALKFTEVGGTVSLTQTSHSDSITVVIEDTGCGMNPDTLKRVFDKFYQGDTSHSSEGNGLGLALAYRVVDKLNGRIVAKSELDKGTIFEVTIPLNH